MSTQAKYWIALDQSKGIGPANLRTIHNAIRAHNLSITDIFDLTANELKNEFQFNDMVIEGIAGSRDLMPQIENVYFDLLDSGIDTVLFFEDSYPQRFIKMLGSNFPPILYTYGKKSILNSKGAAILGEKNLSHRGEDIAYLAAKELAKHGIVIISGLARGADEIAHRSALENSGHSVAILPYGMRHLKIPHILQHVYKEDNLLLISPFYPDAEYNKFNGYIRNRLICALSYAVYIVECPGESGIFEAGKSAHKLNVPLFVTEYANYPESASANKQLINEFNALPVKGKMINNVLAPNMDRIIGIVKFSEA